jgi:adenine-specific DNA-methyltransferase
LSTSTGRAPTERRSLPFGRKYLGSKRLLRTWIADRIRDIAGTPRSFLDGFCGTGAVAWSLAEAGTASVTAVDLLRSNCVILRGCASEGVSGDDDARDHVARIMAHLNDLPPRMGYISESFAGTYFTEQNCGRMDAIREEMDELRRAGRIDAAEHDLLLASFLLAADRVANTLGQYDAFLKNISSRSLVDGKHLVDERVRSPVTLRPLARFPARDLTVVEGDMVTLLPRLGEFAVAYFDPPYNQRQYCDNYHVLENLARWEKPRLAGKTRKFDRTALRSPFSTRAGAAAAMRELIRAARAPHIFVSYSCEGILSREQVLSIVAERGPVTVMETPYPVFGNGAGKASRRLVTEYLFHVRG